MTHRGYFTGLALAAASCCLLVAPQSARSDAMPGAAFGAPTCQILDRADEGLYEVTVAVLPNGEVEGLGDVQMVEFDGHWQFAYFGSSLGGAMSTSLDVGGVSLSTDWDIEGEPSQLIRIALDLAWSWRFDNGFAVLLGTRPGIYSDFEDLSGDSFYVPFSGAFVYAFSDTVSGLAGLDVRYDYGRGLWPLVQLAWEAAPSCRVKLGFPDNRLTFYAGRWQTYLGCDWRSDSYRISEAASHSLDVITFEDVRAYGGIGFGISDQVSLNLEGGMVMEREVAFDEMGSSAADDFDVDDSVMVRVGISGPF